MTPAEIEAFEREFSLLDTRGYNLVSLAALRNALGWSVERLHAVVDHLRRSGRYSAASAEGRFGVSDADRACAIREAGSLLLYISRR